MIRSMLRIALALGLMITAVVPTACTKTGEEVATTFFDPGGMSSSPPTSGGDTDGDTDAPATSSETDDPSESAESGATSEATTNTTMSSDTSGGPGVEQPEDGMYSECASVANCIGLTTCVIVPGAEGGGFCSNTGCGNPGADCDPNPGATATAAPDCIDDGSGALVCALSCAGDLTCPEGMQCLPVGVTMACA